MSLCCVSHFIIVMLSVIMLSVVMVSVVMLNIVTLSVIMLSVIMLNVVMLNVVEPKPVIFNHLSSNFNPYQSESSHDRLR